MGEGKRDFIDCSIWVLNINGAITPNATCTSPAHASRQKVMLVCGAVYSNAPPGRGFYFDGPDRGLRSAGELAPGYSPASLRDDSSELSGFDSQLVFGLSRAILPA